MFSSSCTLPSPASAGSCPPLFGRFTGTTAQSDFSSTCMSVVRLCAFTDRPSLTAEGALEISRFSCMLQSLYWALSRAPQEDHCLLLTKTYMEVGYTEAIHFDGLSPMLR